MRTNSVVIKLDMSRDAHPLDDPRLSVHSDALDALRELVNSQLGKAEWSSSQSGEGYFRRVHDVITIDGARGTGKTTFVLSVMDMIRKGNFLPKLDSKMVVLDTIDPTLIESKENIFVTLIARIKRRVDDHFQHQSRLGPGVRRALQGEYDDWLKCLTRLARGLTLLDGVGSNALKQDVWEDPVFVLQQGLKNATHGGDLERDFHEFIEVSARLLKCKAFVLAFDDIDTDFAKGWPVLEIIRKYLTSPRMIILLSGDLTLFARMVRKRQWQKLGDLVTKYEKREAYTDLVDQLEDQYLLKTLKPENRITLKRLWDKAGDISVEHLQGGESDLQFVYARLCHEIFAVNDTAEAARYTQIFLSQPLRTNIQLLFAFARVTDSNWFLLDESESKERFLDDLADIFFSNLLAKGYPPDMLRQPSMGKLTSFLASHDLLLNGYRLRPEFSDESTNAFVLVVGAFLSSYLQQNPAAYFDYLIKVGLPHEVLLAESTEVHDYIEFVGLNLNEDAIQTARKHSAFFSSTGLPPGIVAAMPDAFRKRVKIESLPLLFARHYGIEDLFSVQDSELNPALTDFKQAMDLLTDESPRRYVHSPESLESAISSWHRLLVTLPFSNSIEINGTSQPRASIFNLLGFLSSILQFDTASTFLLKLLTYAQIREYRIFQPRESNAAQRRGGTTIDVLEELEDLAQSMPAEVPSDVIEAFSKWKELASSTQPLPVYVVAKAWTRFYYTLGRINQDLGRDNFFMGNLIHRYIVAFLNAVLVESMLHYGVSRIEMRNPVTSDTYFITNLTHWRNNQANEVHKPTFFEFVFACPLWSFFLQPSEESESVFSEHRRISQLLDSSMIVEMYGVGGRAPVQFKNLFHPMNAIILKDVDRSGDIRQRFEDGPPSIHSYRARPARSVPLSEAVGSPSQFSALLRRNERAVRAFVDRHGYSRDSVAQLLRDVLNLHFRSETSNSFTLASELIERFLARA